MLESKNEKIQGYTEMFLQKKGLRFIQNKKQLRKFLTENKLFNLLIKLKTLENHKLIQEDLYKWAFEIEAHPCTVCGKPTNFDFQKGVFRECCSRKCGIINRTYNGDKFKQHISKINKAISKMLSLIKQKLGPRYFESKLYHKIQNEKVQKSKQTSRERYGVDHYAQSEESKKQFLQICRERYGVDNCFQSQEKKEKIKQTCLERYGVDNYAKSEEFKMKGEEYAREQMLQSSKKTCQERYGVDRYTQTEEFKQKRAQKGKEKYGVDNYLKTEECKEKCRKTCLEKYNAPNPMGCPKIVQKIYESKRRNGTFSSSKSESVIYQKLLTKFSRVERQFKSDLYPFACDFYVPEVDLYIEYQGTWTHGKEPFNPNNAEHQKIITKGKKKAEEISFKGEKKKLYLRAITGGTENDVKKRNTARENKLNGIEFFNMKEFEKGFSNL